MKKLMLSLFVLVPMAPISAAASIPAAASLPVLALAPTVQNLPGGLPRPTCEARLDGIVAELQAGKSIAGVNSTLIVDAQALAESPTLPVGGGFPNTGGTAKRTGNTVTGTSHVAAPGGNSRSDVAFTIAKVDGVARISWTYKGKAYAAGVDSCHHDYWTATAATSAIAIKLGARQDPPQ